MKKFAIVSYNMYCNFTNYGSALQSYALQKAINRIEGAESVVLDYCPDILKDKDVLNPLWNIWDKDAESARMVELSMPAIRLNNARFNEFYGRYYRLSDKKYSSENFNESKTNEELDGYVCGADTIFCPDEFAMDDGYYANFDVMRHNSVSYAASFGDANFTDVQLKRLPSLLNNFCALGIRENDMLPFVKSHVSVPVQRVLDPTLLLSAADYDEVIAPAQSTEKYVLLYARRYNAKMEAFADRVAQENGWKVIEISLRAVNAERHEMRYDAGVEEFLSLTKHAEVVITNSYHSMIFAIIFRRPFYIFSREQCSTKIIELLGLFGLHDRLLVAGNEPEARDIDYDQLSICLDEERKIGWLPA